jgi:hypothetical protein
MKKVEIWKIFGLFILIYYLNIILANGIISEEIYVKTFSGQLSSEMIAKMLSIKSKYVWVNYLLAPILLLIKTDLIALCFWIGSFINSSKSKFKDYLRLVLLAETVFIVFTFVRTGLLYYYNFQTLTEISQFQPFTLYSILDIKNIPEYFHYPLALVSIPEVIYWGILVLLLKPLISGNFWTRLGFVAKTYGVGLLIWVSIVVFVMLNFTT